jgi:hypothetical protein
MVTLVSFNQSLLNPNFSPIQILELKKGKDNLLFGVFMVVSLAATLLSEQIR